MAQRNVKTTNGTQNNYYDTKRDKRCETILHSPPLLSFITSQSQTTLNYNTTEPTQMNARTPSKLEDVRISAINPLISPAILQEDYPIPAEVAAWIAEKRQEVERVVEGQDDRLLVVVGPCSIHDYGAAIDYGIVYHHTPHYDYLFVNYLVTN